MSHTSVTPMSRRARGLLVVLLAAAAVSVGTAMPAEAASGRIIIRPNLDMHTDPVGGTAIIAQIPYGTTINIECTELGTSVTGDYGRTNIWDRTTYNGVRGFVTDAFVYTGTNGRVAPDCADYPPAPPTTTTTATPATTVAPTPTLPPTTPTTVVVTPVVSRPGPPDFRLPVADGAVVKAGGPHPWNGASGPRSGVDLGPISGELTVVAAASGVATVHDLGGWSRCWVTITHDNGWQTRYLHLKGVPASIHNTHVTAGQRLGQAGHPGFDTCGRGSFRHVHFALYHSGAEQPIDGTSVGDFTVYATSGNYCGYWRRNSTGAIVADARTSCVAVPQLVNEIASGGSSDVRRYIGSLVQWLGDPNPQRTAWLGVGPNAGRVWIPDIATWNCLVASGAPVAGPLPSSVLDRMPDRHGTWARCDGSRLDAGRTVWGPSRLRSDNGNYKLYIQGDRNLVLYNAANRPIWAPLRQLSASYLTLQGDGNLVAYSASGTPVWATNTVGSGARYLVLQNDGNLVIYNGANRPVWASNTVGR